MRKICLKIHRWLGLALGIFISIICFSGAVLVFQDEIKDALQDKSKNAEMQQGFQHHDDPAIIVSQISGFGRDRIFIEAVIALVFHA